VPVVPVDDSVCGVEGNACCDSDIRDSCNPGLACDGFWITNFFATCQPEEGEAIEDFDLSHHENHPQ